MIIAMGPGWIKRRTDIGAERIGDMRFSDDIALLAEQEKGLQKTLIGVAQMSPQNGHEINTHKIEKNWGRETISMAWRWKDKIGANGKLCVSGREHQDTRGV